eukprot:CAMPEP_0168474948 /NCGR_PEP_ID=MMETSP0228-20121227/61109_1 /TAXON_ID=133427 /ORGANISM="Protoceratium reticulatum, Strain CCCM 535 (=CCMP 1889)" /LENGTH=65 /DNA_ID=CAMNT_0008491001 /DNA_START=104 /DNA_END=301 /DNA_ORIENTATION=+
MIFICLGTLCVLISNFEDVGEWIARAPVTEAAVGLGMICADSAVRRVAHMSLWGWQWTRRPGKRE